MKNTIHKILNNILKEETFHTLANPKGRSYANMERLSAEEEAKVWTQEDVSIWAFRIYLNTPRNTDLPRFKSYLGRQMDWNNHKIIQAIQSDPDEANRISYKPNTFVRQSSTETADGFVVAENEIKAKQLIDDLTEKYRILLNKSM